MIKYQLFPRSFGITLEVKAVINCFETHYEQIKSPENTLSSDEVLRILRQSLEGINFKVEVSKPHIDKIKVPVLFSLNNKIDKFFDADAISHDGKIVLEVEAGRAYVNNQFLKDIFQASMMPGVEYLILAVRNDYCGNDDFSKISTFLETLYINGRLKLPLHEIQQLFQGEQPTKNGQFQKGEIYPGDRNIKFNDLLSIQIHRLHLRDSDGKDIFDDDGNLKYTDAPTLAIWIPAHIGADIIRHA